MRNRSLKRYMQKIAENPLPPLTEGERIYLNVPYMARDFAKYAHCSFDHQKKLWFTGCLNTHIDALIRMYGIHESTSDKARQLLYHQLHKDD